MTYKELEHTYRETSPEQFASFIHAVKKARNAGELNSFEISTALCHIADSEIDECRRIGMKGMAMDKNERLRLIMSAKMLACSLVLLCESRSRNEARIRSLLFLEYTSYLNSYKYDLTEKPYENRKCIIRIGELIRKHTNRGPRPQQFFSY